jgi:hypothetical protein
MDASCRADVAEPDAPALDCQVLHLVGRASAVVVDHLLALTRALQSRGVQQTVILVGDARHRVPPPQLDGGIRTIVVDGWGRHTPRVLLNTLRKELALRERATAVHVHGLLPGLLGILAVKILGPALPPRLTLHSRRPPHLLERAVGLVSRSMLGTAASAPSIASVQTCWITPDVSDAFFDSSRHESAHPLVVTASGDCNARNVSRFVQLAVLLESTDAAFEWLGPADASAMAQFAAAGVSQLDAQADAERASRMRQAWVFVAPSAGPATFPRHLAEAMAMGLPCVAWDSDLHRALIEHDRTGLLCDSESALLDCVVRLADSGEVRARLGRAARQEAYTRFNLGGLTDALIAACREADLHAS